MEQYATNYATNSNAPAIREPEVLAELSRLTDGCAALDKLASELEERLKGVLATRQVDAGNQPSSPEPVRVPLAAAFHDRVLNLDMIALRLSSIINRLEI